MSYTLIDNEIFEDENLTHTEFRVLTYLIRNYNSDLGYSFPTRKLMIEKCNMSKDTLNKVLNSLEERGYITRKTNPLKSGRNNIYYIHKYLFMPRQNDRVEDENIEKIDENIEKIDENIEKIDEITRDNKETQELIKKFYAGEITPEVQSKEDELKEKIETFQVHLNRDMSFDLRELISKLNWDEIVNADMQINTNKKDKYCTEKYIINAKYDNKKIPSLKLVK